MIGGRERRFVPPFPLGIYRPALRFLISEMTNSRTNKHHAGVDQAPRRIPPSICIVVENLPVPLDRRVWREACALRDAGYRVFIVCPRGKGTCGAAHEVLDGIEIYRHRSFEASSVRGYLIEYTVSLLAEFFLTLRIFARTRFRILQACNPPDIIFLLGLFLKLFGVRFIFDHHDLGPELFEAKFGKRNGFFYRLTLWLERCSFQTADICIATNESFKDIAIHRGGKDPENVFVVRNCPDLASFRRGETPGANKFGKPLTVAYVGFMGTQDGLDLLLESIEHIVNVRSRRDTHFVLVGGGTVIEELRAGVAQKGLGDYVTLTGQVTHEQVAAYLTDADVGVAPDPKNAMNDNSTMVKILEYMAFSLPVVLYDLKEGRNIAGPSALYATPNNPIEFANLVMQLLDSPELRQKLGAFGRNRIEERLNWAIEKTSLLRAYHAALCMDRLSALPFSSRRRMHDH
jgi:glycosyltransferase involved in cell wall biosynthesis